MKEIFDSELKAKNTINVDREMGERLEDNNTFWRDIGDQVNNIL